MGFRTGAFATIWEVHEDGQYTKARISISRKNKMTGQYEQDFSGFVNFYGACASQAADLEERSRIRLGDVDVSSRYDTEKKREYITYKVFSFDMADAEANGGKKAEEAPKKTAPKRTPKKTSGLEEGDSGVESDDDAPF